MPSVAIVAGEASGDASGAALVEELRGLRPDLTFWGAGGPRMREAGVEIVASAETTAQTGVEMEALVAASVAALTIYDMAKAVDKGMEIGEVRLLEKTKS